MTESHPQSGESHSLELSTFQSPGKQCCQEKAMKDHPKESTYGNFKLIFDYVKAMFLILYFCIIFVYSIDYFKMEKNYKRIW